MQALYLNISNMNLLELWNFTKFLVDKDGQVVKRFAPKDGESEIESELLKIL